MKQYHDLLSYALQRGKLKPTRARLASTGKEVSAYSVFGTQSRYDLQQGFPLVGTKKVSFHSIKTELAWFLHGDTNVKYLRDRGVSIWDEWADEAGELGPVYGHQWRNFGGRSLNYLTEQADQIRQVVDRIKKEPLSRRHLVTAWNPHDVPKQALPPCHVLFQFDVTDGRLSCQLYQRSADLFLGVPYNIASYALLTHLVAAEAGLGVGELIHTIGDAHIYENHVDAVREQLSRMIPSMPKLVLDPIIDVTQFEPEQARLLDYEHATPIKAEVAI